MRQWLVALAVAFVATGCLHDEVCGACGGPGTGAQLRLDPTATGDFYAMPYPNDLRHDATARTIDLSDFPNPGPNVLATQILDAAAIQQDGFALMPVASFAFDTTFAPDRLHTDLDAVPAEPFHTCYMDVDPNSPEYGTVIPAAGAWWPGDGTYVPRNTMTLIPWPGRVLLPGTTYAAIVLRSVASEAGAVNAPVALRVALGGEAPATPGGAELQQLYAPLAAALAAGHGPDPDEVVAATVFTTGDPVGDMQRLAAHVLAAETPTWAVPPAVVQVEDDYCYYEGAMRFPRYQPDEAPYSGDGEGAIAFDADGAPVRVGRIDAKVSLSVPRQAMPAGGYPYLEYIHGSGGIASQLVDRGREDAPGAGETPWQGPAWVAARRGLATGGQAMPISPDRVTANVASYDYIQLTNFRVVVDNFRQGVWELLLRRRALYGTAVTSAGCPGATSPDGWLRFDPGLHFTTGQSMGAMYANMYGALATDTVAVYPTGSGGYWSYFIFSTDLIPGAGSLIQALAGMSGDEPAGVLHPLLGLVQQALEKIDPIVYLPHLVERPLDGVPAKHLLVPHGRNDLYFSKETQRAMAIAYGVPRLDDVLLDPGMDAHMALFERPAPAAPPLSANLVAGDGRQVTAGQGQWPEDPVQENGHTVTFQWPALQHRWGCFLQTAVQSGGVPTIVPRGGDRFGACD